MKLYLVQHADAVSKEEHPDRPLSKKGLNDAVNMAAFLNGAEVTVDEIVHSGKLRAEETANVLARTVWAGKKPSELAGLGPNDSTDHLCNTVMVAGGDLMVVGHMPFMGRMAAKCLSGTETGALFKFEPGSVACFERQDEGATNHWSLNWFMRPSMLPEA